MEGGEPVVFPNQREMTIPSVVAFSKPLKDWLVIAKSKLLQILREQLCLLKGYGINKK